MKESKSVIEQAAEALTGMSRLWGEIGLRDAKLCGTCWVRHNTPRCKHARRHEFEQAYGQIPEGVQWSCTHERYVLKIGPVLCTGNQTIAERVDLIYQGYLLRGE